MFQPAVFFELGRVRSGTALFSVIDTKMGVIFSGISTRHGNSVITWGDGNIEGYTNPKNVDFTVATGINIAHTYATAYSGDVAIKFAQGFRDVYSLSLAVYHQTGVQEVKFNIQNFGTFINQFSNLYSLYLELYAYQTFARMSVIKGDLAQIPNSLKRYKIFRLEIPNSATDYWFNFSTLQGKSLEFLDLDFGAYPAKIIGDLGKLPTSANYIKILSVRSDSAITYTAGKVWASSFDTLSIPFALSYTELDNLLIDMDNSITTKIGAGIIAMGGYRSATSDAAVVSLVAKGFTVNIARGYKLLDLPFQNSFADSGEMAMTMVAGGTSNQPTFALSGRKPGEYCAVFNGSQSIKTTANLPINSDKVTIAFWIKTSQTSLGTVTEMSSNINSNNTFGVFINDAIASKLELLDRNSALNAVHSGSNINSGSWIHIVAIIDRIFSATQQSKMYVNGVLSYTNYATWNADNNGNFVNNILFIGQRAGNTLGFNGSLTKLKIYNYPLTAGEVSTLYNSEL